MQDKPAVYLKNGYPIRNKTATYWRNRLKDKYGANWFKHSKITALRKAYNLKKKGGSIPLAHYSIYMDVPMNEWWYDFDRLSDNALRERAFRLGAKKAISGKWSKIKAAKYIAEKRPDQKALLQITKSAHAILHDRSSASVSEGAKSAPGTLKRLPKTKSYVLQDLPAVSSPSPSSIDDDDMPDDGGKKKASPGAIASPYVSPAAKRLNSSSATPSTPAMTSSSPQDGPYSVEYTDDGFLMYDAEDTEVADVQFELLDDDEEHGVPAYELDYTFPGVDGYALKENFRLSFLRYLKKWLEDYVDEDDIVYFDDTGYKTLKETNYNIGDSATVDILISDIDAELILADTPASKSRSTRPLSGAGSSSTSGPVCSRPVTAFSPLSGAGSASSSVGGSSFPSLSGFLSAVSSAGTPTPKRKKKAKSPKKSKKKVVTTAKGEGVEFVTKAGKKVSFKRAPLNIPKSEEKPWHDDLAKAKFAKQTPRGQKLDKKKKGRSTNNPKRYKAGLDWKGNNW